MRCRGPINRIVMMRARNLNGPFFQNTGRYCVHTAGNFLSSIDSEHELFQVSDGAGGYEQFQVSDGADGYIDFEVKG